MKRYSIKDHFSPNLADLLFKIANDAESEADTELINQIANVLSNSELSKYKLLLAIQHYRIQEYINNNKDGNQESNQQDSTVRS